MNRLIVPLLVLLAGCQPPSRPPLDGAAIGGPFTLTDETGKTVTNQTFQGRYRIVYFGYTFCPDVCPTDTATLMQGLKAFGKSSPALAARIVPLFISIDPTRDTPAVLTRYTDQFDPRLIGLTGSPAAVAAAAKAYGVYYAAQKPNSEGGYLVDHTNIAFLMDINGRPVAMLPTDHGAKAVADELAKWIR